MFLFTLNESSQSLVAPVPGCCSFCWAHSHPHRDMYWRLGTGQLMVAGWSGGSESDPTPRKLTHWGAQVGAQQTGGGRGPGQAEGNWRGSESEAVLLRARQGNSFNFKFELLVFVPLMRTVSLLYINYFYI